VSSLRRPRGPDLPRCRKARRAPAVDLDSRRYESSNGVLALAAVLRSSAVAEHLAAVGGDHAFGLVTMEEFRALLCASPEAVPALCLVRQAFSRRGAGLSSRLTDGGVRNRLCYRFPNRSWSNPEGSFNF
jgi:hypothetical protein